MPLKYICFSSFEEKLFSTSKFTLSYLVLVIQSCPTLCDPRDYSPPSFSVHGILQARILEWDAIPFSSGSSQSRDGTQVTCIASRLFTIWTTREDQFILRPQERKNECEVAQSCPTPYDPMDYIAFQVPPSMGFLRQKYWNGLPFLLLGDLPDFGIKPGLQAEFLTSELPGKPVLRPTINQKWEQNGSIF